MLSQKCRICGERHPLGPCPNPKARRSRAAGKRPVPSVRPQTSKPAPALGASRVEQQRNTKGVTRPGEQRPPITEMIERQPEPGSASAAVSAKFDKKAYQREYMRRWRLEHSDDAPKALYRHFAASGQLLYVGVSENVERRNAEHARSSPWWKDVVQSEVEYFGTTIEALAAESRAVAAEAPLHNQLLAAATLAPHGECSACDTKRTLDAARQQRMRDKRKGKA
jgi:hypothetical protein